jgi:primosomal protein N' (replication factor Y) (superfamily II helicase)
MNSFATVVIPPLQQLWTYQIPEALRENAQVGMRVEVPFGKRKAQGYIIQCHSQASAPEQKGSFEIKSIVDFDSSFPCFFEKQLQFYRWIAEYYGDPLANVIDAAIPAKAPTKTKRYVSWKGSTDTKNKDGTLKGTLQLAIRDYLISQNGEVDVALLNRKIKGASAALKRLEMLGLIMLREVELLDQHLSDDVHASWAKEEVTLNQQQYDATQHIIKAIDQKLAQPILLHGITGSGKTEVYIEAARHALAQKKGVLIIVPEIALTPQLIERFRARLGNQIAILHSGLNKRTRWDSWRALIEKRNCIAIGARSAIFAPVSELGLIIVDEEHDSSYKQSDGLRYNARDLSVVRAKLENCPVVLGSATPSLETYYYAQEKRYHYVPLSYRHQSAGGLKIEIVDLNILKPWDMPTRHISPQLHEALKTTLSAGEQAFILYNRRGFASYLQCEKCDFTCQCPNCSVTMTYHQGNNTLLCHYCSFATVPSVFCPECSQKPRPSEGEQQLTYPKLEHRGAGTEKIFDELRELFPATVIERLDRDSASDLATYKDILDRLRSKKIQVLVGTQMLAKGHDLPDVTLVGVSDCDVGLHMPDFRASERIFQLLTQASGRAGRGERAGRVLLQTRVPKHQSLLKTLTHDYPGFADYELKSRKAMLYPPFTRLLRIVATSLEREHGIEVLTHIRTVLESANEKIAVIADRARVLGPTTAALQRLKGEYRAHLMIKCLSPSRLNSFMKLARHATAKVKKVRVTFDVDPQDML